MSKALAIHCHTTGINYDSDDITTNQQPLSIALGVVDLDELKLVDHVNVMVKFQPDKYTWNDRLEKIHGISKEEASEGEIFSDAAAILGEFIYNHFGVKDKIQVFGYNPLSFHVPFLNKVLHSEDLVFKFDTRDINLYTFMVALNKSKFDEMLDFFGIEERPLSSLFLIKTYVKIFKTMKTLIENSL